MCVFVWLGKYIFVLSYVHGVKIHEYVLVITRVKTPLIPPLLQIDIRKEIDMQTKSAES